MNMKYLLLVFVVAFAYAGDATDTTTQEGPYVDAKKMVIDQDYAKMLAESTGVSGKAYVKKAEEKQEKKQGSNND